MTLEQKDIVIKNGKKFVRQPKLPRGAYVKSLAEVLSRYVKQKKKTAYDNTN